MDNLAISLGAGLLLMLLVLAALRFRWRGVLVALVSVPLSLITAGLLLRLLGQGFNALVFLGLGAAVAVVVDEAVVFTDRFTARLRDSKGSEGPRVVTAARAAAADVRAAMVYATLIVLLAVVPVAVLGGRPGAFFEPMVLAYALAVGAAVLVAVTVTPALTLLLHSWRPQKPSDDGMQSRFRGRVLRGAGAVRPAGCACRWSRPASCCCSAWRHCRCSAPGCSRSSRTGRSSCGWTPSPGPRTRG